NFQFAGLSYPNLTNIGDHIQSIAAERLLPRVGKRFERDGLRHLDEPDQSLLVMNGWFSHRPEDCFPLAKNIVPIYFGFHLTDWNGSWNYVLNNEQCLEHFRMNGPIGCRDSHTAAKLSSAGIETFYSKCLTLTFPKARSRPRHGWNVIVDVPFPLPPSIEDRSIRISHAVSPEMQEHKKRRNAEDVLDFYRNNANLVITTRLHCALPCLALGIPVVFFGDSNDYRISITKDLGLPIYSRPEKFFKRSRCDIKMFWDSVDWQPDALDVEQEKQGILDSFSAQLWRRTSSLRPR
ncbi:unnamed protein product, partial [Phaeothamnion confervicola]